MFIFHNTRNAEVGGKLLGKVPLWDLFSNKKAQVKKNQCQKKSKKNSIQYHQIRCYQYHLRTTLILQRLDLKLV